MADRKIFDIIICGGTVIDGSGDDRFQADIGIVDDTIKEIGFLSGASGGKVIDATNRIVAPGFIDTDMTAFIDEEAKENIVETIPLKRFGRVNDVSELVYFLSSDNASYITGQTISVDGGLLMY